MDRIAEAIVAKRAEIAKLQVQIELLEELAEESRERKTPGGRRRKLRGGRSRGKRRPRGANQQQVLAVLSGKPQRLSEIGKAAGLGLPATASVLQAVMKKALVQKGKTRGTYLLSKGAGDGTSPRRSRRPSKGGAKKEDRAAVR